MFSVNPSIIFRFIKISSPGMSFKNRKGIRIWVRIDERLIWKRFRVGKNQFTTTPVWVSVMMIKICPI